ncbi:hypothetical protein MKW94_029023 [Papaver nudicaule]|uniref:Cupin type-1 domain-containing protein n=1 Tax=Papaver nudicaule TaxID=74823 RepID=A0AA42AW79_PAPNU|nr:hypothetical protein [Papaver nudicaule]
MAFVMYVMICLVVGLLSSPIAQAGDPDIITDFVTPANATLDGSSFAFTGIRNLYVSDPRPTFRVTKMAMKEFPALNGQSVSMAILHFPAGAVNRPHTHPRSAELLFLTEGSSLDIGFVDTTNMLFTQTLQEGDIVGSYGCITTGIDDAILANSFKTDVDTIQKIKAGLASNPKA